MIREIRRLTRLLMASWVCFVALTVLKLNASALSVGWYCR